MGEYADAKLVDGKSIQINVKDHKTYIYYGPARVTFTINEFDMIKTYVEHARGNLKVHQSDKVFLSWSGRAMASGDISSRVGNLWSKSGVIDLNKKSKNVSSNIMQKSASTIVRENSRKKYTPSGRYDDPQLISTIL